MSYVVIGVNSHEQYGGTYQYSSQAYQYINGEFEEPVNPRRGDSWVEHTRLNYPEPLKIVRTDRPLEDQMPYTGKDSQAYHIRKNDEWHRAHRVRERIG